MIKSMVKFKLRIKKVTKAYPLVIKILRLHSGCVSDKIPNGRPNMNYSHGIWALRANVVEFMFNL